MNFTHLVIIRFNVGLYDSHPDPHAWLKHRMELFDKYHVPGIVSQSKWFCCTYLVDPKTSQRVHEWLRRRIGSDDIIKYCLSHEEYMEGEIDFYKHSSYDWIVTTRLDSDDVIEPKFIERVQAYIEPRRMLIDTAGRHLDAKTGKCYKASSSSPSPFLTTVEPASEFKGCYQDHHRHMDKHFTHRVFIDEYLYIKVVHDRNISNRSLGH